MRNRQASRGPLEILVTGVVAMAAIAMAAVVGMVVSIIGNIGKGFFVALGAYGALKLVGLV